MSWTFAITQIGIPAEEAARSLSPTATVMLIVAVMAMQLLHFFFRHRDGVQSTKILLSIQAGTTAMTTLVQTLTTITESNKRIEGLITKGKDDLDRIVRKVDRTESRVIHLVTQHDHADDSGFGTRKTNELLLTLMKAVAELSKCVTELLTEMKIERRMRQKAINDGSKSS